MTSHPELSWHQLLISLSHMGTGNRRATTLRLPNELMKEAQARALASGQNLNSILTQLLEGWVKGDGRAAAGSAAEVGQVANLLALEVAQVLSKNQEWVSAVVQTTLLAFPKGYGGFGDRIHHFAAEKKSLAENFCGWLVPRTVGLLQQGKNVHLVIDSGTTLYWVFRQLGPALARALERDLAQESALRRLTIVTNNLVGVEAYMTEARLVQEGSLPEVVQCRLLPGTALPAYAAVTGADTEAALREYRQRQTGRDHVFIGLVTGNWVWLDSDATRRCAVPLARGTGHREFKEELIDISDEVYVITPLAKVLINVSVDTFNHALGNDSPARSYEPVRVKNSQRLRMKLVSTTRQSRQLLDQHSTRLQTLTNPTGTRLGEGSYVAAFDDVPDLLFDFSAYAAKPAEEEFVIEFPHPKTRRPEFAKLFGVAKSPRYDGA